ncbi:MAG: leucine-rich repeat domain-containing protein [Verrucomicrobia bacterium]|nr:leucine-rich repeat domain-containing protein [Verrucomicrobiota bacterium]
MSGNVSFKSFDPLQALEYARGSNPSGQMISASESPQALSQVFSFMSGNNKPADLLNLRTVREVCTLWNQVAELAVLKPYWHMVKELPCFKLPFFVQAIEDIEGVHQGMIGSVLPKFQALSSKLLPPPTTLVLPRDYQTLFDSSLEKVWGRLHPGLLGFHENEHILQHANEIRAWLNDPANAERINKVQSLDLSNLELEVLPSEIGIFTQLKTLNLQNNRLFTLPPQIKGLVQLAHLDLSHNRLESLPPQIESLVELKYLNLDHNELRTLPPEIGRLIRLVQLYIDHNKLDSWPPEFGNLAGLHWLLYSNNPMLPEMPSEIRCRLINLRGSS